MDQGTKTKKHSTVKPHTKTKAKKSSTMSIESEVRIVPKKKMRKSHSAPTLEGICTYRYTFVTDCVQYSGY